MIQLVKSGGDGHGPNYREYIITGSADVATLPTGITPEPDTAEDGADPVMENALLGAIRHGRPDDLKNLFSRYQISASQRARRSRAVRGGVPLA